MNVLKELLNHMAFNEKGNYSDLVIKIQDYIRTEVSPELLAQMWQDPLDGTCPKCGAKVHKYVFVGEV
jgi:hypothetical protein